MKEENIILKCTIKLNRILYPKNGYIENGDFAIFSAEVVDVEEGEPVLSKYGTISVKGKTCSLECGREYTLVAKEKEDDKWGMQYEIVFIGTKMDLSNPKQQKIFLEKILTETQFKNIYKAYDDPIPYLENGDIQALMMVKGVGEQQAINIIKKYNETKDYSNVYIKLDAYGLTKNTIEKLVETYGGPDTLISKIEENPYLLIDEVDGFGWVKADNLALSGGMDKFSKFRIKAYIKYLLREETYKGNTWTWVDDFSDAVFANIGYDLPEEKFIETMHDLEEEGIIWLNKDRDIIALKRYYNLESKICMELVRLATAPNEFEFNEDWIEKIHRQEERQGWQYGEEQLEGIKAILENNVTLIIGSGGCVDCDTEYFNGDEWKKISKYKKGDKVLQYDIETREATLAEPLDYIKSYKEELYHVIGKGIDQCLSPDHRMLYKDENGDIQIKYAEEVKQLCESDKKFKGRLIDSFYSHSRLNYLGNSFINNETKFIPYKTKDGYEYCFTMPKDTLILRRNGNIFITMNCGKSSTVAGMLEVFDGKYTFAQTALSGRASGNLTDITGEEGFTIHRLLSVDPETGEFRHNKKNPIFSDIVVLDELSMVGEEIFYSLIQSIADGRKLVMLGDIKQLEAIGMGNLIKDLIECGVIKVVELTKIHRQAEASGIITESLKASRGEYPFDSKFTGTLVCGELEDMVYDVYKYKLNTAPRMLNHYKELLDKGVSYEDIQLITPMKDRGAASAYNLSNEVQKILIERGIIKDTKNSFIIGEKSKTPRTLYVGDRIINKKNNYSTKDTNGKTVPIFNGDLGKVIEIRNNSVVVKFSKNSEGVVLYKKQLQEVFLGYCIVTHALQGSSAPYVICGLDYSHYKLLTKEMVYTMITRAKKYCVFCCENKAMRYAVKNSNVRSKQTFLAQLLKKAFKNLEEYKKHIIPTILKNFNVGDGTYKPQTKEEMEDETDKLFGIGTYGVKDSYTEEEVKDLIRMIEKENEIDFSNKIASMLALIKDTGCSEGERVNSLNICRKLLHI